MTGTDPTNATPDHQPGQQTGTTVHQVNGDQPPARIAPSPTAVLEGLPLPVLVLDSLGELVAANAARRRVLDAGVDELVEAGLLRTNFQQACATGAAVEQDLSVPGSPPWQLRVRLRLLDGGAAVELLSSGRF